MILVHPGPVGGTVPAPGSKSHTHRALLLAAQSDVPATVSGALRSADTDAMLGCLLRLGARAQAEGGTVRFQPADLRPTPGVLDCRNAGTALRLLAATVARWGACSVLDGDASLRTRPNADLLAALASLGATCSSHAGRAPLAIQGPLRPGMVRLPAGTSSQFASSLLLALPMLPGPSQLTLLPPVASAPYLDLTCAVAGRAGLRIARRDDTFTIAGSDRPRLPHETVEGDWSAAAFPLVAAAVTQGEATVQGVRADSVQGDRAVVDVLRRFGATVTQGDTWVRVQGTALVAAGEVDVAQTPDLFPALSVAAAVSRGTTTFTGGAALRHKESDRIAAMARGLQALGVEATERPDGLIVNGTAGRPLRAATLASEDDHRIHMALAVAALAADGPCRLDGEASAAVSYPSFYAHLRALGARTEAA